MEYQVKLWWYLLYNKLINSENYKVCTQFITVIVRNVGTAEFISWLDYINRTKAEVNLHIMHFHATQVRFCEKLRISSRVIKYIYLIIICIQYLFELQLKSYRNHLNKGWYRWHASINYSHITHNIKLLSCNKVI